VDTKLSSALGIIVLAVIMRIPTYAPTSGAQSNQAGGAHAAAVSTKPHAKPKTSTNSAEKETEIVSENDLGPGYATCEFSNPKESLNPPAEQVPLTSREGAPPHRWCFPEGGAHYRFLFATVPDPVDTHLALDFDRRIEAILDAAQASGFSYDRYWLPWEPGYVPLEDNSEGHRKILHQLRSEQPGLLLLRRLPVPNSGPGGATSDQNSDAQKIDQKPEILFVFLIGETPTAGIHRLQFANAMRYMKEIDRSQYDPQDPRILTSPVRVLGPSFSGSAYSLLSFLEQYKCKSGQCFHLVSSSATRRGSLDALHASKIIELKEVMHDDDYSLTHFLDFVKRLGFTPWEVALLTEDTTEYGQVEDTSSDPAGGQAKDTGQPLKPLQKVLTITFPRELAQLRNAYPDPKALSPGGKNIPIPQQGLTLTLKGSPTSQDDVPAFSGQQLPLSQEAVLLNIATTLRREQIRFVGIFATDIFDTLFLSRFLRSECPNIRIFIVQSDLMMTRASEEIPLQGALAITTYPLIGRNQYWTASSRDRFRKRNLLSSATTQSTYNATIVLLSEMMPPCKCEKDRANTTLPEEKIDKAADTAASCQAGVSCKCANPYGHGTLLEYSSPLRPAQDRPPLWLTVIGRNGYLPLALLDEEGGEEGTPNGATDTAQNKKKWEIWHSNQSVSNQSKSRYGLCRTSEGALRCEPPSLLWTLILGVTCCWSLLYVAAVWLAVAAQRLTNKGKSEPKWLYRRWWLEDFAIMQGNGDETTTDKTRPDKTHERSFYLLMESLVAAAMVLIISAPWWRTESSPFVPGFSVAFVFIWLSPVAVACLLTTAGYLSAKFYGSRPKEKFSYRLVWTVIGWALFVVLCILWIRICYGTSSVALFFDYRSLDLASSASPVTPIVLLLAGFCVWARIHMQRLRFSETRRPCLPAGSDSYDPAAGVASDFENAVCEFHDRWLFLSSLALFVIAFFLLRPMRFLRSLEGVWFDTLYIILFAVLYYAIVSNWIRFLAGWCHLRQFLRRVEGLPLRFAFNRLAREFSWAPIWKRGGTRRTYAVFTRSNDYLQVLAHSDVALLNEQKFKDAFDGVTTGTEVLLKNDAQGRWDDASAVKKLQDNLTTAADELIKNRLQQHWDEAKPEFLQEPVHKEGEKGYPENETADEEAVRLAEDYVALRYLAFIRYASLQLRNLLGFLTTAFILSLISVRSYPFQEPRSIGWTITLIFAVLGAGIVLVFAEMDKDHVLSRLSNTRPDKLDREFFLRVISFGALPLLTVIASQFPSVGRFLFSWVQPGLEALR
jgi:hypothetical protein